MSYPYSHRIAQLQAAAKAHPLSRATGDLAVTWFPPDASLALSVNR